MKIALALEADAWGGVDANSLERGIGGREGALIRLAREWARLGHEVTCFVPTRSPQRLYEDAADWEGGRNGTGFYEFVPYSMAQTMMATFPYDACVAWECPRVFANPMIVERNPVRLVEMQCAHMMHPDIDATAEFATGVVSLSPWHAGFLEQQGVPGPHYVLPNGVDLAEYQYKVRKGLPRKKNFIYSSSPDRGLWHLLRLWPNIRERWPEAELNIAYGLSNYLATRIWSHRRDGELAVAMAALAHQPGINNVGKLSHHELAKLQCESTIMAYPCDTIAPTETGCITVIEGMAAGLPVVTTDCDCLESEFGEVAVIVPLPILEHETAYFDALVSVLEDRKVYTELSAAGRAFAEERQWKDIAKEWLVMFEELHP